MFIHESPNWPNFTWNQAAIDPMQAKALHALGYLAGRMSAIGFDSRLAATVEAVTNDVVASSAIEGVKLNTDEVRSSVARKFGIDLPEAKDPTHYVEGIVEMMLDATHNHNRVLTSERLFDWHCALFPNARNLTVGAYRTEEMSVISGSFGRERIHYRAPAPEHVPAEMERFIQWFNAPENGAGILKSAIAHLWFVSIHPFDDGNGRIGRALSDMVLAELDGDGLHFYSLSRQILKDKSHYYKVLERTQRGSGDITEWLQWYFGALISATEDSNAMLSMVLRKATFWNTHSLAKISERQRLVLNKYLDGYDAKLTAKNWAKIAEISTDTALRDINALVKQRILEPTPGRVRDVAYSINYTLSEEDSSPFQNIRTESVGADTYILADLDSSTYRDRISPIDLQRLQVDEITLTSLAHKHFAHLL